MKFGLIGEKLGHSFSKEIHEKIADYEYEIKEIPREDLEKFAMDREFSGINVTIPYKQQIIPYLDFIDEKAAEIGAVNTVINKHGKLYGYNTDFGGLLSSIQRITSDLSGKKVLILGDGGASRAAQVVIKHLNASEILIVSRSPGEDKISYEEAEATHTDANVIINATPVGMYPNVHGSAIHIDKFDNLELVIDVVYNPLRTDLIIAAEKRGIPAIGGLYMLVSQAVLAAGYFTETKFSISVTDRIYNELVSQKRNIVLTGMPGCGKTTIGKVIAEKLNREFIDTDDLIVKKVGCEITEIFATSGEAGFRKIESEIIEEVSLKNNCIISTGGGAILNDNNITNLKHNGIIFFLDRPLDQLIPTSDRPTASDKESIINRYEERIDLYNSTNDFSVKVIDLNFTSDNIINLFKGNDF